MRYKPTLAHPYLCVCALLEMIIRSLCDNGPTQFEIADYFGINAPKGLHYDGVTNIHYTNDPNTWGLVVRDQEINEFFFDYGISLTETFLSINLFEDWSFEDKLEELLQSRAHIICGYADRDGMTSTTSAPVGHAVLILQVEPSGGMERDIVVYDPGPESPGQRRIRGHRLFADIKAGKDGIWVIRESHDKK